MCKARWILGVPLCLFAVTAAGQVQREPDAAGKAKAAFKAPPARLAIHPLWRIIQSSAVQRELGLTDDQKLRLTKIKSQGDERSQQLEEGSRRERQALCADADVDALRAVQQRTMNEQAALGRETEAEQSRVLNRRQRARLEQIRLQADGPMAFLRSHDLRDRLNLDPEQVQSIAEAVRQGAAAEKARAAAARQAMVGATAPDPDTPNRRIFLPGKQEAVAAENERLGEDTAKIRRSVEQAVEKILTKKQRATYRVLRGSMPVRDR
jgi:Spy/CpxP family protein refolding chaperone